MGFIKGISRNQMLMASMDDLVSTKNIVRVIDRYVDSCDLQQLGFSGVVPAETGREPYSPACLIKLLLYGYENGIRSSRKLEGECGRNIEVMWLMQYLKPAYKTISEFRKNNIRALQKIFRDFVRKCIEWGLIDGELVVVDGTKIKASNNKKNNFTKKKLLERVERIDEYLKALDEEDQKEDCEEKRQKLVERKEKYEGYISRMEESGENEISEVDPDARLMGNNRGGVEVAYNVQSAVDGKNHLIMDFDVSMNPSDQHQLGNMVNKVRRNYRLKKFTVLADKGYYNGEDLQRMKRYRIKALVARQMPSDPKDQPERFHTDQFIYDPDSDTYICPMNQRLERHGKNADRIRYYNEEACKSCPHRNDCARSEKKYRSISRSKHSKVYEEADRRMKENGALYKRRQQIVEHPFGTIKCQMHGTHFLLRTRRKVCGEVALLFFGYNLKRAVNILGFEGIMAKINTLFSAFFGTIEIICHFARDRMKCRFQSRFLTAFKYDS